MAAWQDYAYLIKNTALASDVMDFFVTSTPYFLKSEPMETNYDALIQASADELFSKMEQKESVEDMARLRDAFEFAREAHLPQKRKASLISSTRSASRVLWRRSSNWVRIR